jgi:energy-coupling factor transport system substrate-specific component
VSWIASSFALLVLALAGGFVWWERTRPSAREVALVAALAALAALGRVAFAPIPNVKPTTDIVLLTGFVLGAGPGFATGAVAAIASNVVFGQGPWTPWEMAGWGLTGLMGAALGAATGRHVARIPLALYCGLAGLVYGALLDVSVWVGYAGQHTLNQYLLVSGSSAVFNIAHATGNVVFCLAFGPAFVRALERFRTRLHVTWSPA